MGVLTSSCLIQSRAIDLGTVSSNLRLACLASRANMLAYPFWGQRRTSLPPLPRTPGGSGKTNHLSCFFRRLYQIATPIPIMTKRANGTRVITSRKRSLSTPQNMGWQSKRRLISSRLAESGTWLGMGDSNPRFLIQSQASYHWTNPQRSG